MLTTDNKVVKETLIKNLLLNTLPLSKNNMEENKKPFENQPYNEYINLNSFINNQISLGDFTLSTTERTRFMKEDSNSRELTIDKNNSELNLFKRQQRKYYDDIFLTHLIFNKMKTEQYHNYINFIQKTYNKKYGKYIKNIIINKEQNNFCNDKFTKEISHLENIIARYSIIIFFLVKDQQMDEAKNLFLLMIKENIIYINFFEKNLFKEYSNIENNIKLIQHGRPKSILTLSKIYSIILKYSFVFNFAKNRNIFLSRYLSLQKLNYNLFLLKSEIRGSYLISDIAIKYFYANCLFNASYYSIMFYSVMSIPIKLCEFIFKLYEGMDEVLFEKKEKSLILKTSFNYALFIYLNGNNELALDQLELIKEKLISFYEYNYSEDEDDEGNGVALYGYKDKYDLLKDFKEKKGINDRLNVNMKQKIFIKKKETMKKMERRRGLSKSQNTVDKIQEILFNRRRESTVMYNTKTIFDPFNKTQISAFPNNKKKTIKIEDIKKFFISDVKTALNKKNRKCSITERDISNKLKFQNYFGVQNKNNFNNSTQSIVDLRTSHINFRSILKINKLDIPKYMTDSILIETELLMCEIEIDSKNMEKAYEHFKNSILALFISKQNDEPNDYKSQRDFRKKLRIISMYLKEINTYIDEKSKKKRYTKVKNPIKTTKTFLSISKKKLFTDKNMNFKKSSVRLGKNRLLESLDININEEIKPSIKGDEYYNKLLNEKLAKEIEKFFLFLISLSVYQLKLLNDTQPKREIRNDLPILFNGQFKDSLSSEQRNNLYKLHTTSITRNMILNAPDKLILPTNLNFRALNYNTILSKDFINKNSNYKLNRSKVENHKFNKIISLSNSIEYDYFKKIIFSNIIGKKLQKFLLDNYSLVMRILKELNPKEIDDIIKYPNILVAPINNYKKKKSIQLNNSWYNNNNNSFKNKKIKDLKKLIYRLNNLKNEKENEKNNDSDNTLIDSDSENSGSINISINNTSFLNNENDLSP